MRRSPWYSLFPACLVLVFLLGQAVASRQDVYRGLPEMRCPLDGHDAVEMNAGEMGIFESPVEYRPSDGSRYRLPNGLNVTVYSSDLLAAHITWRDDGPIVPLPDGRYVGVITDINDPAICNKGDGSFHPFEEDDVVEVLKSISHGNMSIDVVVYILPYPRRNLLVSSASGSTVFLSPHVLEIHPAVCAYLVTHEVGHVFQDTYMPNGSPLWERYRNIRGITDPSKFSTTGPHAYRPAEIFAEDFRVLYGNELASFGGRVENPELPSPFAVSGLREFMDAIGGTPVAMGPKVRATSYPNPFNPDTEIRITVPGEILTARERVTVRIYDVRGALVKEVYSDVPTGENLYVQWDGHDRRGDAVASGNYFALVEAGRARTTLKLALLK
jgi:hypothetical protein